MKTVVVAGMVWLLVAATAHAGPWWQRGQTEPEPCPTCEICEVCEVCGECEACPPQVPATSLQETVVPEPQFVDWRDLSPMYQIVSPGADYVRSCLTYMAAQDIVCGRMIMR